MSDLVRRLDLLGYYNWLWRQLGLMIVRGIDCDGRGNCRATLTLVRRSRWHQPRDLDTSNLDGDTDA